MTSREADVTPPWQHRSLVLKRGLLGELGVTRRCSLGIVIDQLELTAQQSARRVGFLDCEGQGVNHRLAVDVEPARQVVQAASCGSVGSEGGCLLNALAPANAAALPNNCLRSYSCPILAFIYRIHNRETDSLGSCANPARPLISLGVAFRFRDFVACIANPAARAGAADVSGETCRIRAKPAACFRCAVTLNAASRSPLAYRGHAACLYLPLFSQAVTPTGGRRRCQLVAIWKA